MSRPHRTPARSLPRAYAPRAGREPLATLLDRVSDGIIVLDREWYFAYVNDAGATVIGRAASDLVGKHIWSEFPGTEGHAFRRAYEGAMESQRPSRIEAYYAPWDRWFENRIYPSADSLVILFHDISDRKRAEVALEDSVDRLQLTVEGTQTGLWDWDLRTNAVRFSREWKSQIGYEDDEIADEFEEWRKRVHADDLEAVMTRVHNCIDEARATLENEYRFRHKDGSYRWILSRAHVIADLDGAPARIIGFHLDLTERRLDHQLLEGQNRVLELVATGEPLPRVLEELTLVVERVANGPIASILLLDEDGVHLRHGAAPSLPATYVNAIDGASIGPETGSCGTAMYRRAVVVSEDIMSDPLWRNYREIAAVHGLGSCWSAPILDAEGRVLGSFALYGREPGLPAPAHRRVVSIATHLASIAITHARKAAALRASYDHVRKLAASLERSREAERIHIAREIHDELGQVLTGLKLDLAWLQPRLPPVAEVEERIDAMKQLVEHTVVVIRRLAAELRPGVLDDLGLAAALRWQAREFERRTGITVHTELPDDLATDAERSTAAFRVVQEALTNVARHARARSTVVRARVDQGVLTLEVEDDGIGITAGQSEVSQTFGLLGIRERVETWGGDLEIGAATGGGTLLRARIPLDPDRREVEA
jgi:PAS domain S-box-containing protein